MRLKGNETRYQDHTVTTRTECVPMELRGPGERPVENKVINLYPEMRYQTFLGFGGAMTEAAAYALSRLSPELQEEALRAYFGPEGSGYTVLRTHIDSCDFSREMYQAVKDVLADPGFSTFSLERDREYIIPAIRRAMAMSSRPLQVLLSPWSPPAEWKTESEMLADPHAEEELRKLFPPELSELEIRESNPVVGSILQAIREARHDGTGTRVCGGHLKPEYYAAWAKYLVTYIRGYLDAGIPVRWLSIQNEAQAATPWDSCVWTAEEERTFLHDHLYPAMREAGLDSKVGILVWDHNKERVFERACEVLAGDAEPMAEGVAFHWYSGDHFEAVRLTHERFPDKLLMFTEGCCGFSAGEPSAELEHAESYAHDIIGNLNSGMHAFFDWNLYLDEQGGPNHVGNYCDAPVMLDGNGGYRKNASYYFIRQISAAILPGAVRIGVTKYTDKLDAAAFQNPDGTVALVVLNRSDAAMTVNVRLNKAVGTWECAPHSVTAFTAE